MLFLRGPLKNWKLYSIKLEGISWECVRWMGGRGWFLYDTHLVVLEVGTCLRPDLWSSWCHYKWSSVIIHSHSIHSSWAFYVMDTTNCWDTCENKTWSLPSKSLRINHKEGCIYKSIVVQVEWNLREEFIGSTWKSRQTRCIGIDRGGRICRNSKWSAGRQRRAIALGHRIGLGEGHGAPNQQRNLEPPGKGVSEEGGQRGRKGLGLTADAP